MKVLCCGDIHGDYEAVTEAFNEFLSKKYDRIIFIGDICDSFHRKDEDIIRCWNIINSMIKQFPDKVIVIIGNHDAPYLHYNPEGYRCKGFRPFLHLELNILLYPYRKYYKYAYGIKNYLFTHAGVQYGWYAKHFHTLDKYAEMIGADIEDPENMWMILNSVSQTKDCMILHEIGPERGGLDSDFGGPTWCDLSEILKKGPYPGLNQIIGHTATEYMYRFHCFEGDKHYPNTSISCIDVLSSRNQFLTLNIAT